MNSIYYENSKIVIEDIKKDKSKSNLFDTVKDEDGNICAYDKKHLKSLKKKKYADTDKAVAFINTVRVIKNGDRYVSYIYFDEENLKNLDCCTFAVKDIKRAISASSVVNLIALQVIMHMNIMRMNSYRHF